jgi:hypothetical protein
MLLIGFLLILGISLMVLDAAIEHAPEGHEDELGFHQESTHRISASTSSGSETTSWDQAEGANCPLDMSPSFRPIGNAPFTPNGQ